MATKTINLMDSEIPQMFSMNLRERCGYFWWPERTGDAFNIVFTTIAGFLKRNASKKDKSTGVCLKDAEGNFIIAGVLTYTPPEEDAEDDKGNFNLEFVTSEKDYNELEIDHDINDYEREIYVQSEHYAWELANGRWKGVRMMWDIFRNAIDTLFQFLSKNLDEAPEDTIEVTLPGVFTAAAAVEDGEKSFAIIPAGAIKQIIKSDVVL
jgi:hypothetical protein